MTPVDMEVDITEIEKESNALVVKANSFAIVTNEEYVRAMEFAKTIKAMQKEVESAFGPIVKKAHETWKQAIAQKDKYLAPLDAALKLLDGKGRAFRQEQERIRQEEERKAQELARKEAARLESLKKKAEARGDQEKAQQFEARAQEAASITPIIAPKVDKVDGIVVRKVWKYRITDPNLLPRDYLKPDDVKIGSVVRATKGTLQIPGVQIYAEDSSL